jgi:hypothetical protein
VLAWLLGYAYFKAHILVADRTNGKYQR